MLVEKIKIKGNYQYYEPEKKTNVRKPDTWQTTLWYIIELRCFIRLPNTKMRPLKI